MASVKRQALLLSFFTVAYNLAEGTVAMIGSSMSGSTALLAFGIDSFVESLSGCVMIWRFWSYEPTEDEQAFEQVDQTASRLVACSLLVLGAYIILDSSWALYYHELPNTSLIGIGIATASLIVTPVLFWLKYRLGKYIGSQSMVADSKEALACMLLSATLLLGLGALYIWRLWWIDPVCGIVIASLVLREGYLTWRESK